MSTRMVVEEVETPSILADGAKVSSTEIMDATPSIQKKSCSPVFWIIVPGIFLLGAILGGIVFYQKGVSTGQTEIPTPTPTTVAVATPTASPSIPVDLTKYTITIFNGSGIAGEAGRAKTLLTTSGFRVGTTGNAATYNFTKTVIKAKSTVEAGFTSALSTALGKNYLVDTAQITIASSSADTVQVVIGSSKAQ